VESDALDRLGQRLGLEGLNVEDWDLIFADPTRVEEFCDLYDSGTLSEVEKQLLMQLVVASLDELLRNDPTTASVYRVESLLRRDRAIHEYVIAYWACRDEVPVWVVTPMMRRVRGAT
jgi:hypothetical protein